MDSKHKTSFGHRLFRSKLVIIFEVLILVVLASALGKEMIRKYQIESEINELQNEVSRLEDNNIELNSLITYFQSDSYKEEQARLKLGLQREGESVITVLGVAAGEDSDSSQDSATNNLANDNIVFNPQQWWDYFFKNS
ncbi:septum formation initiator family protein [Patescibacteria group bacterium]|nr:septum formation initiator family protein [Patescibacteria group bacterium]